MFSVHAVNLCFITLALYFTLVLSFNFISTPRPFSASLDSRKFNLLFAESDKPQTSKYEPISKFSDEYLEDDPDMDREMARELYDELRGKDKLLSLFKFYEWEDIKEVLARGYIDNLTLETIIEEAGVVRDELSFDEFYEVVGLVNQVSYALEEASGLYDVDEDLEFSEDENESDLP